MKSFLIGFTVIVGVATLARELPKQTTNFEDYSTQSYRLKCVMCPKQWETEEWSNEPGELSPFSYHSGITLFCSMACRNQWQLTRKIK